MRSYPNPKVIDNSGNRPKLTNLASLAAHNAVVKTTGLVLADYADLALHGCRRISNSQLLLMEIMLMLLLLLKIMLGCHH